MELILPLATCRCISLLLVLQCIVVLNFLANKFSLSCISLLVTANVEILKRSW